MKGITIETSCEKNDDECVKANVHPITLWNINELKLHKVKEYSPEKIIALRKKAGLSQAALAKVFNISSSAVQQWEVAYHLLSFQHQPARFVNVVPEMR